MKTVFLYWRLAIFRITGKALVAAAISVVTTLNGAEWSQFTQTQKFVAFVSALAALWMVIDAFLDSTISELRKHPDGLGMPNGDTTVTQRTELASVTTTTVEPKPVVDPKP